jgi:hypothetical protein
MRQVRGDFVLLQFKVGREVGDVEVWGANDTNMTVDNVNLCQATRWSAEKSAEKLSCDCDCDCEDDNYPATPHTKAEHHTV